MATTTSSISELFVTTYRKTITDSLTRAGVADANNFIEPTSILARLRDVNRVFIAGSGSDDQIGTKDCGSWKHQYASGQSGGSFIEGESFPAAGDDSYDTATVAWRSVWEPVEVSGLAMDTAQGMSVAGEKDIWIRRFENATLDLFDTIEDQLLLDGTGNSGANIDGLKAWLAQTGTYAGISITSNAWWRPYLKDAASAALSLSLMRDVKYQMKARKSNWTAIWTSQTQQDAYRDLMGDKVRTTNIKSGDLEREVPMFDGRPVIDIQGFDDDLMVFVNEPLLGIRFLPPSSEALRQNSEAGNFQGMPLRLRNMQPDRDSDALAIIARCNHYNLNPYKHGYLDSLAT